MKDGIYKLLASKAETLRSSQVKLFAEANDINVGTNEGQIPLEKAEDMLNTAQEMVYAHFTGTDFEGNPVQDLPPLTIKEALNSSDVSIVFPRVINTVLQEPVEPNLFLTNNVAEVVRFGWDQPNSIEFPTVDSLVANDMAEGQDYTAQTLSFSQHSTSIRIGKVGLAAAMNEETLRHSMWPLIELHLRHMSRAINRKIESNLYQAMVGRARVVFDNDTSDTTYRTTGQSYSAGAVSPNGSISYDDILKMAGVLLGARYNASHILVHPLAWPIMVQDPIMRAQFFHGGVLGTGGWGQLPSFNQQVNFPFNLTYVPYYALAYNESDTLTASPSLSGLAACLTTDIYMIDRANALWMATRGEIEMDQMDWWFRDAKMIKCRKYVGVSVKDQGKGIVVAKNIRVVKNEQALFTVNQVAS